MKKTPEVELIISYLEKRIKRCDSDLARIRKQVNSAVSEALPINQESIRRTLNRAVFTVMSAGSEAKRTLKFIQDRLDHTPEPEIQSEESEEETETPTEGNWWEEEE